jgi:hypothetical protein
MQHAQNAGEYKCYLRGLSEMSEIRSCNTDIPQKNWDRIFGEKRRKREKEEKVRPDIQKTIIDDFNKYLNEKVFGFIAPLIEQEKWMLEHFIDWQEEERGGTIK